MFFKKTFREEFANAISEIDNGQRREPRHDVPTSIKSKWSEANPIEQFAFEEFSWFGGALDWNIYDNWSFEETSDIMRRARCLDGPEYGRRWNIYFNNLMLGWVEISPAPIILLGTLDEYRSNPRARVDMELSLMRFIPTGSVYGILHQASLLLQSTEGGYDAARERARLTAESAMTRYMWDVMRAGETYVPDLEFSAEGPYTVFRETIAHWNQSGFSPLRPRI